MLGNMSKLYCTRFHENWLRLGIVQVNLASALALHKRSLLRRRYCRLRSFFIPSEQFFTCPKQFFTCPKQFFTICADNFYYKVCNKRYKLCNTY